MNDYISRQKDIEKPKSCYAVIDGETKYCPFVNKDDDCVLQLGKSTGTWEEQYNKCPLVEASELYKDVIRRQAYMQGWEDGQKALREEIWEDGRDRLD